MKKALLTFGFGPQKELLDISLPSKKRYAQRHGYDLILGNKDYLLPRCEDRPYSWWKVKFLQQCLDNYDVLLWLDADIVVVRSDMDILNTVRRSTMQAMVCHSVEVGNVINCGVWVLQNSTEMSCHQFLDGVWFQSQFTNHAWWEQAAVLNLLGVDPNSRPITNRFTPFYGNHTQILGPEWNWHKNNKQTSQYPRFMHATTFTERAEVMRSWSILCT